MVTPSILDRSQIGFWRMELGEALITVVSDGTVTRDARHMLIDVSEERIDHLMALQYRTPRMQLSINMMLIDTGSRLSLIDTGPGDLFKPEGGLLSQNLMLAGYDPHSIDDVVVSHIHADHSGGLIAAGKMVFPNAQIHIPARDFQYFMDEEAASRAPQQIAHVFRQARTCLGPYVEFGSSRVYEWGQQVIPGITSRAPGGHTPGHSHLFIENDASAPYLDSDHSLGGIRPQRHRDKTLATLDSRAWHRRRYCNRVPTAFGRLDPTMQHGGVEAPCQRHRRNRYSRLLARPDCFGFDMCTMDSSTSTAGVNQLIRSIHVNAYLLS